MGEVTDTPTIDPKLAAAFVAFQSELTPVPKSADNPFFKSKYADLGAIQRHVQPLLAKNKLAVMQPTRTAPEGGTELVTRLVHESGAYIEEVTKVLVTKNDAQAKGSGITYERRYAYSAMLGVVTDDEDDDGNAASSPGARAADVTVKPAPVNSGSDVGKVKTELTQLMTELMVVDPEDEESFFMDAIGKPKATTLGEATKAIEYAKIALADRKEAAELPGANG